MPRTYKQDPAFQTNLPEFENFERYVYYAYGQPSDADYQTALQQAQIFVEDGRLLVKTLMESEATTIEDLKLPPQMNQEYCATALQWFCTYHAIKMGHSMHKGMYVLDLGYSRANDLLFNAITGAGYIYSPLYTSALPLTLQNLWYTAAMGVHLTTCLASYLLGGAVIEYAKERYQQFSSMIGFKYPYARLSSHFNQQMATGSYQYGIDSKNYRYPYVIKPNLLPMKTSLIIRLDDGRVALKPENRGIDISRNLYESIEHLQTWSAGTQVHEGIIDLREKRIDFDLLSLVIEFIEMVPDYNDLNKKIIDAASKPLYEGQDKQAKYIYETIGFYPDILKAMDKYGKENQAILDVQQKLITELKLRYGYDKYFKQYGRETTLDFLISDVNTCYFDHAPACIMNPGVIHQSANAYTEEFNKLIIMLQRDLIAMQQLDETSPLKPSLINKIQLQLNAFTQLKSHCEQRNADDETDAFMKHGEAIFADIDDISLKAYAQKYLDGIAGVTREDSKQLKLS